MKKPKWVMRVDVTTWWNEKAGFMSGALPIPFLPIESLTIKNQKQFRSWLDSLDHHAYTYKVVGLEDLK